MKAEFLIKSFRKSVAELNDLHQQWVETNGRRGCKCLNYEEFKQKLEWTDEQILEFEENKMGYYIIDKEEYLANKKEKTN